MQEHDCVKCVVDFTNGEFISDTQTTLIRQRELAKIKNISNVKFATVVSEPNRDMSFFKTVLLMRGYKAQSFGDIKQAIEWLNE